MRKALGSKLMLFGAVALAIVAVVLFIVVPPKTRDTVRVVNPPSIIASLPHWVAEERGFYRDAGIEVKAIAVSSSALMAQAITSRDADVLPAVSLVDVLANQGQALDRPLIFSHSRMVKDPPFESILVLTGSKLATFKDLAGKRIAVYPGATSTEAVKLFLRENGVDPISVVFRPLPPPEHITALERGDVDASHLYEPLRTQALAGKLCRELVRSVYAYLNEPSAIGVSAISSRFAMERPKAAQRYLEAWDRSIIFIREHPDEARAILAQRLKLSPDVAKSATWVDATLLAELDMNALSLTVATVKKMGLVPDGVDANPSSFVYARK